MILLPTSVSAKWVYLDSSPYPATIATTTTTTTTTTITIIMSIILITTAITTIIKTTTTTITTAIITNITRCQQPYLPSPGINPESCAASDLAYCYLRFTVILNYVHDFFI